MANVCCRFGHINRTQVENGAAHIMTELEVGVVYIWEECFCPTLLM